MSCCQKCLRICDPIVSLRYKGFLKDCPSGNLNELVSKSHTTFKCLGKNISVLKLTCFSFYMYMSKDLDGICQLTIISTRVQLN